VKYLFIICLLGFIGCDENSNRSKQVTSVAQELSTQTVNVEPKAKKTWGEICDFHDDEERETYRVFIVFYGNEIKFFRVNEIEDFAFPGLRTANIDLFGMFQASESDNFWYVSLLRGKIEFKDNGVWRTYEEVIKAYPGLDGVKYVWERTRFLRDIDKYAEKDWEESTPEPFRISFCKQAEIEVRMDHLPRRPVQGYRP